MNEFVRLHVWLARQGAGSRRACEALIRAGRVTVDGLVAEVGEKVSTDPGNVCIDGQPVRADTEEFVYLMLHKPAGVTSTCADRHAEKTVLDLVPEKYHGIRLYPVGRLDRDSTGLVLLTNDGELANRLTHPSHHVAKYYRVWLKGRWDARKLRLWQQGVSLDDGKTAPADVHVVDAGKSRVELDVTLREGRKRQLRRMAEAVDCRVVQLHRYGLGSLRLGELKEGRTRPLVKTEQQALRQKTC